MKPSRLLGRCGGQVRAQLWAPHQPTQSLANGLSRNARQPAAIRGFRTSPRSYLKRDPANDDPEDYFGAGFSKRRHDRLFSADAQPKRKPQSPATPSAAPFSEEANGLADGFGFLFE